MSLPRRLLLLALALVVAVLVLQTAFWDRRESMPPAPIAPPRQSDAIVAPPGGHVSDHAPSPPPAPAIPPRATVDKPEKWRAVARGIYLRFVEPATFTLQQAVIDLLELTPAEVQGLNEEIATFLERVRAAETANAYVLRKRDGTEEIVVALFDRKPLLEKFREAAARKAGKNVADFCAEQMLYDDMLGIGNSEVRLYTELGNEGRELQVISRGVHRRNSSGNPKWEGDAAPPLVTKTISKDFFAKRYGHLFSAASRLPRKSQPP